MLDVMDKYGALIHLEQLHIKNVSMGSLLILLPFAPNLSILNMSYYSNEQDEEAVPNLTDELFSKIFQKNKFEVEKL